MLYMFPCTLLTGSMRTGSNMGGRSAKCPGCGVCLALSLTPPFPSRIGRSRTTKTHCLLQLASTNGTQSHGGTCVGKCKSTESTRHAVPVQDPHTAQRRKSPARTHVSANILQLHVTGPAKKKMAPSNYRLHTAMTRGWTQNGRVAHADLWPECLARRRSSGTYRTVFWFHLYMHQRPSMYLKRQPERELDEKWTRSAPLQVSAGEQ